ncbi:MAG: YtxH domain-containing protein [Bacteroidetes bacterium]|nr:YtxH domain-containing protein [Bacteroidota bacterium]
MANSGSKVLLAALVGVAAGIGVGMLIAPAKGSKTRKRLKKRIMGIADMMQDDLSEKVNAFKSAFSREEQDELSREEQWVDEVKKKEGK